MKFKGRYFEFKGKKYAFDFEKLKEVCLTSSKDGVNKEVEISQAYEPNDEGDLVVSNKVEHETRIFGNQQNDMIKSYTYLLYLLPGFLPAEMNE